MPSSGSAMISLPKVASSSRAAMMRCKRSSISRTLVTAGRPKRAPYGLAFGFAALSFLFFCSSVSDSDSSSSLVSCRTRLFAEGTCVAGCERALRAICPSASLTGSPLSFDRSSSALRAAFLRNLSACLASISSIAPPVDLDGRVEPPSPSMPAQPSSLLLSGSRSSSSLKSSDPRATSLLPSASLIWCSSASIESSLPQSSPSSSSSRSLNPIFAKSSSESAFRSSSSSEFALTVAGPIFGSGTRLLVAGFGLVAAGFAMRYCSAR